MGNAFLYGQSGGGIKIKSIQRGTGNPVGVAANITISPVDVSKSIVIVTMHTSNASAAGTHIFMQGRLTSSTNLDIRSAAYLATYTVYYEWQVIEFANVKSIQSGIVAVGADAYATPTINSINTAKSALFFSYYSSAATSSGFTKGNITSSTTIQFLSKGGSNVSWFVVEFE